MSSRSNLLTVCSIVCFASSCLVAASVATDDGDLASSAEAGPRDDYFPGGAGGLFLLPSSSRHHLARQIRPWSTPDATALRRHFLPRQQHESPADRSRDSDAASATSSLTSSSLFVPSSAILLDLNQDQEGDATKKKRNEGPSLSLTNPMDVLRQRMLMELARERMRQTQYQIEANAQLLNQIGKRNYDNDRNPDAVRHWMQRLVRPGDE